VDDEIVVSTGEASAFAGAVSEAVTNAGKHACADTVVVFVDRDDDGTVFVSVRDDGVGFDPAAATEGHGLAGSIRGRMAAIGGRAEIVSAPRQGVDVRLWLP
jgi:signal transduction histidine kinase